MNCKQRRAEQSRAKPGKGNDLLAIQGLFEEAIRHQQAGRMAAAERLYRQVLDLDPRHAGAANNVGVVIQTQGRAEEALEYYKRTVAIKPDAAEAWFNAGNLLLSSRKLEEAKNYFERAIEYKPGYFEAWYQLGAIFTAQGQLTDAERCYRQLLVLRPDDPASLDKLGCALFFQDKMEESLANFERAHSLWPGNHSICNNMAVALKGLGRLEESIACSRKAIALKPDDLSSYTGLLLTMVYAPFVSPEELAAAARQFGEKLADPVRRQRPLLRDMDPGRRLRIGYVSADFRKHPVNYFFEFLLKRHDRAQFETFAYSSAVGEDHVTARLKPQFDHWRNIQPLNDDKAADLIEADRIDILVDMAGHTGGNRLMVFARKPAPVQVTWLGYPATTGMKAMDYRITDFCAEPEGMTERLNVEDLWRLPGVFCCYGAQEDSPDVIDRPPFEDNGAITFGCFNNFAKVSDPVLGAWAKIMARVPGSRLLLEIAGVDDQKFRSEVEERLRHLGLPLDRIIMEPRRAANQFVLYNRIDIALDPFPCVGGTTSFDTLWMGVPFVTLAGNSFLSRMGVTILTNAGLPELIAGNVDEYVQLATDLALDKDRLRNLRRNLRERVAASLLMDQEKFTRNMEAAYREMWRRWCNES